MSEKRQYTLSPILQAQWELGRKLSLEKLKRDAEPIYGFIKDSCERLSMSIDPCNRFFYRKGQFWVRIQEQAIYGAPPIKHLHVSHARSALKWLINKGHLLQDNFDRDHCTVKWYTLNPDNPFLKD